MAFAKLPGPGSVRNGQASHPVPILRRCQPSVNGVWELEVTHTRSPSADIGVVATLDLNKPGVVADVDVRATDLVRGDPTGSVETVPIVLFEIRRDHLHELLVAQDPAELLSDRAAVSLGVVW